MPARRVGISERFERYVQKTDTCWLWAGVKGRGGYGRMRINGRDRSAHRAAWEMANGQAVPDGMHVCHRCDVPSCVNPEHLFLGTAKVNKADAIAKGRSVFGRRSPHAKLTDEAVREARRQ